LAKHVETNNKYAESETMLQLELDVVRTDCEKYQDDLKAERVSVQEKDGQIKELKSTMVEKVRKMEIFRLGNDWRGSTLSHYKYLNEFVLRIVYKSELQKLITSMVKTCNLQVQYLKLCRFLSYSTS
jgi:hypothetical protein